MKRKGYTLVKLLKTIATVLIWFSAIGGALLYGFTCSWFVILGWWNLPIGLIFFRLIWQWTRHIWSDHEAKLESGYYGFTLIKLLVTIVIVVIVVIMIAGIICLIRVVNHDLPVHGTIEQTTPRR